MANDLENIKRLQLKEKLAKRIRDGEFPFGSRVPGLHALCDEYAVSYVTAAKAMKLLEKEGYLYCRNGVGNFVCYTRPGNGVPKKIVNFITGLSHGTSLQPVIDRAAALFRASGWQVEVFYNTTDNLSSRIREINSPDAWTVVFFINFNWEKFAATLDHIAERLVVIGRLSGNSRITSIISDEYETVKRCLDYFHAMGRRKIGLVTPLPLNELEMLRTAAWRSMMSADGASCSWLARHCFAVDWKNWTQPEEITAHFSVWLAEVRGDMDAVIVPCRAEQFVAACREQGIRIHDDLAVIITAGQKAVAEAPDIPVLSNNLAGHFEAAKEILEERFNSGKVSPGSWHFCVPGALEAGKI